MVKEQGMYIAMTMSGDDKSSVKSSKLDDLIDNLVSDEELKPYLDPTDCQVNREAVW